MLFSVVIPVFNRSETLHRALLSVLSQTVQSFEIWVVDDGSSEIFARQIALTVKSFDDPRIKLLVHNINQNGAAARNTGIDAASGDYICFLDSDDEWLPNKLASVEKAIYSHSGDKGNLLVHHQYTNIDYGRQGKALPAQAKENGESVAHYSFVSNNVGGIQSSTICVAAGLAKSVKFNPDLKGHQDWDFALRIGNKTDNFIFINQVLVLRYRNGEDSVAKSLDWQYSLNFLLIYHQYFTAKSVAFYLERVVLKKAIQSGETLLLLRRWLFWKALFFKPSMLLFLKVELYKVRYLSKRIDRLFNRCHDQQIKSVILWGFNMYTREILKKMPDELDVIAIIDNYVGSNEELYAGISIHSITNVAVEVLARADVIVLVTDSHQDSMIMDLANREQNALTKIKNF